MATGADGDSQQGGGREELGRRISALSAVMAALRGSVCDGKSPFTRQFPFSLAPTVTSVQEWLRE